MSYSFTVPTFVAFLQDLEAPYEVKDYVRIYLGMNYILSYICNSLNAVFFCVEIQRIFDFFLEDSIRF